MTRFKFSCAVLSLVFTVAGGMEPTVAQEAGEESVKTGAASPAKVAAPTASPVPANQLQIGSVAPDIEGEDIDGVPFKLSDYRGQVLVLDFWGDW